MSTVTTAAEMLQALSTTGDVSIEVTQSLDISSGDITSFVIADGVNATITIGEGVTITGVKSIFDIVDGGKLTLNGTGTILGTTKNTNAAVYIKGSMPVLQLMALPLTFSLIMAKQTTTLMAFMLPIML